MPELLSLPLLPHEESLLITYLKYVHRRAACDAQRQPRQQPQAGPSPVGWIVLLQVQKSKLAAAQATIAQLGRDLRAAAGETRLPSDLLLEVGVNAGVEANGTHRRARGRRGMKAGGHTDLH
jgi:hypothetical protein